MGCAKTLTFFILVALVSFMAGVTAQTVTTETKKVSEVIISYPSKYMRIRDATIVTKVNGTYIEIYINGTLTKALHISKTQFEEIKSIEGGFITVHYTELLKYAVAGIPATLLSLLIGYVFWSVWKKRNIIEGFPDKV